MSAWRPIIVNIYSLLRNSNFAEPKVPAERMTRPVPGVTLTLPVYPAPTEPPCEHSNSTPVMWPPVRISLLALVLVMRWKFGLFAAVTRYVARGPWRSAFSRKNVLRPYVWFFSSGWSFATMYLKPAASKPFEIVSKPCWRYNCPSLEGM